MTSYPPSYCPDCGSELASREEEGQDRAFCPDCERIVYHNPVPGAAVTVVDGRDVLLVQRAAEPGIGEWSVPGGHIETGEHPREAAARELEEETGLGVDPADLVIAEATKLDPLDGKYMVSIGFVVEVSLVDGTPIAGSDAGDVGFFEGPRIADGPEEIPHRPHTPDRVRRALERMGRLGE